MHIAMLMKLVSIVQEELTPVWLKYFFILLFFITPIQKNRSAGLV